MSELDDAIVRLDQAVVRLEAAVAGLARRGGADRPMPPELAAAEARRRALTAAIVARVDAALGRIGQALEGGG